jgi:hypothetical protein
MILTQLDKLSALNSALDADALRLRELQQLYDGTMPLAYLSPKDREALKDRLDTMAVALPRLVVRSIADRCTVTGFRRDDVPDADLWAIWRRNRMQRRAGLAIADSLTYGRAYLLPWVDAAGLPTLAVSSPQSTICETSNADGSVLYAVKRWVNEDGTEAYATLFEPDKITRFKARGNSFTPDTIPVSGWVVSGEQDNPLGVVPVIPIVHQTASSDRFGRSALQDVRPLVLALNKLLTDGMVTSETFARPKRWATGVALTEDDETGEIQQPFDPDDDMMISEDEATKFGQFTAADLKGYAELSAVIMSQVSAVSGLPPHMVGASTAVPPSAESLSVALDGLSYRVKAMQQIAGEAFADAVDLADALAHNAKPRTRLIETVWAPTEPRSLAANADAAAKLLGAGVDPQTTLRETLGWQTTVKEQAVA